MEEYFVTEKKLWERILDLLVFFSVLVVVVFLLLDIMGAPITSIDAVSLAELYFWIGIVVLIIFSIDLIRLRYESDNWRDFFQNNWLDVLATIPFALIGYLVGLHADRAAVAGPVNVFFKAMRVTRFSGLARTQKINRVSKIGKQFKAASHFKKESEDYQRKHRL